MAQSLGMNGRHLQWVLLLLIMCECALLWIIPYLVSDVCLQLHSHEYAHYIIIWNQCWIVYLIFHLGSHSPGSFVRVREECHVYYWSRATVAVTLFQARNVIITVCMILCGGGRFGTMDGRSPRCFCWVLPKRSIPKPDPHLKDIIQQESLGTDMLQELMNSNYTRYYTKLINRSFGGWLVSTLL